jgi:hypothetical protein
MPPYVDKWNLKSRTWLQRHQLLHNSLYQGMVLSMSAGLQVGNVNLPVLRHWRQILGFSVQIATIYLALPRKIPKQNI